MRYKPAGTWVFAFGFLVIIVATLTPVYGGKGSVPELCLLCHSRGMADFLSNIILFMPLAFGLRCRGWTLRRTVLAAVLLSLTVETLQLLVVTGRDPSPGDLAANSVGGLAGWIVAHTLAWWRPRADGALARTLGYTTIALAVLLGGLSLLVPAPPSITYFIQWTADLGHLEHYRGRVLESRLGPFELHGATRVEPNDSLRQLIRRPTWNVRFIAGVAPSAVAPIVSIYDGLQREVVLLGARSADLVYRQRLRAAVLLFDQPDLRVWSAFAGVQPGDAITLGLDAERARVCVRINTREQCGHGYTAGDTWALLMLPESWGRIARTVMTAAWLFGTFLPAGFLAYRAADALVSSAVVLAGLLVGPPAMGFGMTPAWQVSLSLAGLFVGYLASLAFRNRRQSAAHSVVST